MAGTRDVRQLMLQVDANIELARRNLNQLAAEVERDSQRMDRSLAGVDGAFGRVGTSLGRVSTLLASAGLSVGVGTFVSLGRSALNFADDLDAAADRAGMSVERYQTLRQALRALEVDTTTVDRAFGTLQETLGSVQSGVDNAATQALDRLGIKARILNGEIDSTDELLDALAAASRNAGTEAQFLSNLSDILGRRVAVQLAPALRDGGEAMRELEERARSAGSYLSQEQVQELADANEAIDEFAERTQYTIAIWAANVIRSFQQVDDAIAELRNSWINATSIDPLSLIPVIGPHIAEHPAERARRFLGYGSSRQGSGGQPGWATWRTDTSEWAPRGGGAGRPQRGTADEVRQILRGIGANITSGFRTPERNRSVRGASNSRHLTGQAFDIALTPGMTRERIQQALEAHGYRIQGRILGPGDPGHSDHFHVPWAYGGSTGFRSRRRGSGASARPSARTSAPSEPTLDELRQRGQRFDRAEWERITPHLGPSLLNISAEQLNDLGIAQRTLADFAADMENFSAIELPNLATILSEEDQQRLENFRRSFLADLADGLAGAIVRGENLGDVLVNTIQRAAHELIATGLLDLLQGYPMGESFFAHVGSLFGLGLGGRGGKGGAAAAGVGLVGLAGKRAAGGPVSAGLPYLVGERGPEIVVPRAPGVVIPNHALGGGAGPARVQIFLSDDLRGFVQAEAVGVAVEVVRGAAPGLTARAEAEVFHKLRRPGLGRG